MNRRNFIKNIIVAIPTISCVIPENLYSTPSMELAKYKYDTTHEYDWNNYVTIYPSQYLALHGIKILNYCASIVDINGNIGGIDYYIDMNHTEPFTVKMYILESLSYYNNNHINLEPTLSEITEKMECVVQTMWLKDKTINKTIPFVRGLSKERYKRMVKSLN